MLEVRALRAGYGAVEVLRGVDLDIARGEIVALLGSMLAAAWDGELFVAHAENYM